MNPNSYPAFLNLLGSTYVYYFINDSAPLNWFYVIKYRSCGVKLLASTFSKSIWLAAISEISSVNTLLEY